jgi:hypothetical protein
MTLGKRWSGARWSNTGARWGGPGLAPRQSVDLGRLHKHSSAQTLVEGCGLVQDIWNPDAQNDDTLW